MQSYIIRGLLSRLMIFALALPLSGMVLAQTYPSRPVRLVVPFSAGAGVTDIMARILAKHLGDSLGQPVVIDNRPGAGGVPGTDVVAKAAPDGYTFLISNVSHAIDPYLYAKLPFDPLKDFVPVTLINSAPLLLVVNPALPVKSTRELIAYAKAHPGKLAYGSGGVGTTPHLSGELFLSLAGIDAVHVPYKGGAPALNDLMGGQVQFMIENMPGTMPFVKGGRLRALAITGAQRSPLAPDLPTMAEAGVPGYEVIGWNAIFAVKGTPPDIVARMHTEVARILRMPEVRQQMAALGAEPIGSTPDELAAFLKTEMARWGKVIKDKGIRAE
jgi:tripartite-type tricarboxylate transporter receptor subunit TctC